MASTTYQAIADIANFISGYAVTLAAVGALTVALVEAYKKLFSTQGKFHQAALLQWLRQDGEPGGRTTHYAVQGVARATRMSAERPYAWQQAYNELLHLTTGLSLEPGRAVPAETSEGKFSRNVSAALFELELAKMMGQVQEAADAALNNPTQFPALFAFLTRGCADTDIEGWQTNLAPASSREVNPSSPSSQTRELADIYGRLRLLVRRQLDSFQTVTGFRWRELNQLWAIIVGAVLLFIAQTQQLVSSGGNASDFPTWAKIIVVSLLGGMLAPVAKDLVDGLARVKSGG